MSKKYLEKPIVFLAPGAGLGHVVRASSIALELEKKSIPCLIAATSQWAKALSQITGIATTSFSTKHWGKSIVKFLETIQPSAIIQDTFPFGFKNEDLDSLAEQIPFIYLARYLKTGDYLKAINKKWDPFSPLISTIIEIEPLSKSHIALINQVSANHYKLKSRIMFPSEVMKQPVPEELKAKLSSGRLHLVVHSGPHHETERLVMLAASNIKKDKQGEMAIISPALVRNGITNAYDYFPAAALFSDAYKIYTGGGYNAVAETASFLDRSIHLPFPRNYDDQSARIETLSNSVRDDSKGQSGAARTAEIILSAV